MTKKFSNNKRGASIFGLLFLGILIILFLSYLHISIRSVVDNPDTRDNFNYVAVSSENIWQKYLKEPTTYLWHLLTSALTEIAHNQVIDKAGK